MPKAVWIWVPNNMALCQSPTNRLSRSRVKLSIKPSNHKEAYQEAGVKTREACFVILYCASLQKYLFFFSSSKIHVGPLRWKKQGDRGRKNLIREVARFIVIYSFLFQATSFLWGKKWRSRQFQVHSLESPCLNGIHIIRQSYCHQGSGKASKLWTASFGLTIIRADFNE